MKGLFYLEYFKASGCSISWVRFDLLGAAACEDCSSTAVCWCSCDKQFVIAGLGVMQLARTSQLIITLHVAVSFIVILLLKMDVPDLKFLWSYWIKGLLDLCWNRTYESKLRYNTWACLIKACCEQLCLNASQTLPLFHSPTLRGAREEKLKKMVLTPPS